MKIILLLIGIIVIFASCEEDIDRRLQGAVESEAPEKVIVKDVINIKGQSEIIIESPSESDILYVECQYKNTAGKSVNARVSGYSTSIKLPGFRDQHKQTVTLISVDKSGNVSESTSTEIEPLKSQLYDVVDNIEVIRKNGGIQFSWLNVDEEDLIIDLFIQNEETQNYKFYESHYSDKEVDSVRVRDLESKLTNFAFVIRNQYFELGDTAKASATPIYEELMDVSNINVLPFNPQFDNNTYSSGFETLWNGKTTGDSYSIMGAGLGSVWFGMDLGEEVKLTTLIFWSRVDFIYAHSMPRKFEIWGTNDLEVANNASSFDGWNKIGDFETIKPSLNDLSVEPTQEDKDFFLEGLAFEFDGETLP